MGGEQLLYAQSSSILRVQSTAPVERPALGLSSVVASSVSSFKSKPGVGDSVDTVDSALRSNKASDPGAVTERSCWWDIET